MLLQACCSWQNVSKVTKDIWHLRALPQRFVISMQRIFSNTPCFSLLSRCAKWFFIDWWCRISLWHEGVWRLLLDCCHWLIMRSRRCKDYKNHFAHLLMVMKIACAPILNSMSQIALFCKSACSFAPHIHWFLYKNTLLSEILFHYYSKML